jgi:hypothetical protein
MEVEIKRAYLLSTLIDTGCRLGYNPERCLFASTYDEPRTGMFHLLKIPEWRDEIGSQSGKIHWAPQGFSPVGFPALIGLSVEHPLLQETIVIVATGAPDDSPPAAIYHPYLGQENGERMIAVPNFGVAFMGDNGKKGVESNLYGLFRKK